MDREIICTVCPRGCHILVKGDGKVIESIEGYGCKRGEVYANSEYTNPVRILTTTVKIKGKDELLPVRSNAPISKSKILECMEVIKGVSIKAHVKRYDVSIENILGTGVDIVATKDL